MLIQLTRGKVAIIDDEDWPLLSGYRWGWSKHGYTWYAQTRINKRVVSMHRVLCGLTVGDGKEVDHVDGDGLNNRRLNLRVCTHAGNQRNAQKRIDNSTGYKGVYRQANRFVAGIKVDGKQMYLGRFDTAEQAHLAYVNAAKLLHGEFANFGEHTGR